MASFQGRAAAQAGARAEAGARQLEGGLVSPAARAALVEMQRKHEEEQRERAALASELSRVRVHVQQSRKLVELMKRRKEQDAAAAADAVDREQRAPAALSERDAMVAQLQGLRDARDELAGQLARLGAEKEQLRASIAGHLEMAEAAQRCVVCWDAPSSYAIVPCGHVCCCGACLHALQGGVPEQRLCPKCRGGIESVLRVFL